MGDTAVLSKIVEGVEFTVRDRLVTVRAVILRDALEAYFGADASPQSWLRAYREHRHVIDKAAADRYRRGIGPPLTILSARRPQDFAHLATGQQPMSHIDESNDRVPCRDRSGKRS